MITKPTVVKLARVSICPCGEPTLHDHIAVGTEYTLYPTSEKGWKYRCGGCGKEQEVRVIWAERDGESGVLPVALFDLEVAA